MNRTEPVFEDRQLYRIDGKNCFFEINRAFDLGDGKLNLFFVQYDPLQGNRQTAKVSAYLDVAEFLYLANAILCGELKAVADKMKAAGSNHALYENLGGTSAKRLEASHRAREDGKSESRRFTISLGTKSDFYVSAESGPGEESATGLIVPLYGKSSKPPEVRIGVPVSNKEMQKMALIVDRYIAAWFNRVEMQKPADDAAQQLREKIEKEIETAQSPSQDYIRGLQRAIDLTAR